jgi:hypothetical protein
MPSPLAPSNPIPGVTPKDTPGTPSTPGTPDPRIRYGRGGFSTTSGNPSGTVSQDNPYKGDLLNPWKPISPIKSLQEK